MSPNYYNEIDPYVAAWLRNLIQAGHIAPGDVDERSIEDVHPDDLRGYAQCHFFAGIGVWSYALRRAGWPDDRSVWTGSCPCQPFSQAGEGAGFADERHLWPAFHHLIRERRPAKVLGEQVASKDADPWVDLVHTDMEALGYAFGAVPFPSAGVGAPHIRDRLYWVANADDQGPQGRGILSKRAAQRAAGACGVAGGLAFAGVERLEGERLRVQPGRSLQAGIETGRDSEACRMADADGWNASAERQQRSREQRQLAQDDGAVRLADSIESERGRRPDDDALLANRTTTGRNEIASDAEWDRITRIERPGPTNGFWRSADWLGCTDGKWRPVEPGTFPLAHGAAARVGRLRAYGNAINAEAARVFIEVVMECAP